MRDYPCVLPATRCPNKHDDLGACHGALDPRCYTNWGSTDPEDTEPYEEYLRKLEEA